MIYIIHFGKPYHHARHYVGYCADGKLEQRLAQHRKGQGSPLIRAVQSAGIDWRVALTAPGDRAVERTIKRAKHTARFCPLCIPWQEIQPYAHFSAIRHLTPLPNPYPFTSDELRAFFGEIDLKGVTGSGEPSRPLRALTSSPHCVGHSVPLRNSNKPLLPDRPPAPPELAEWGIDATELRLWNPRSFPRFLRRLRKLGYTVRRDGKSTLEREERADFRWWQRVVGISPPPQSHGD